MEQAATVQDCDSSALLAVQKEFHFHRMRKSLGKKLKPYCVTPFCLKQSVSEKLLF